MIFEYMLSGFEKSRINLNNPIITKNIPSEPINFCSKIRMGVLLSIDRKFYTGSENI
jgi:hypothetical protein